MKRLTGFAVVLFVVLTLQGCAAFRGIVGNATPFTIPEQRADELATEFGVTPCTEQEVRMLTCYARADGAVRCVAGCTPSPFRSLR